mmetsp:Transcript_1271/g.1710  ORF Transcript_1271/g.1710 Transcript_1271/m.1710 type:complete len:233 (-) Transcript_1271:447-1145(-)
MIRQPSHPHHTLIMWVVVMHVLHIRIRRASPPIKIRLAAGIHFNIPPLHLLAILFKRLLRVLRLAESHEGVATRTPISPQTNDNTVTLYSTAFKKIFDIPLRRRKRQSSALHNQRFRARALGARVARTLCVFFAPWASCAAAGLARVPFAFASPSSILSLRAIFPVAASTLSWLVFFTCRRIKRFVCERVVFVFDRNSCGKGSTILEHTNTHLRNRLAKLQPRTCVCLHRHV